ncbi:unnamed protein product (macronuclear) [Paramecium tetraurelia]|uniref:TRP C-terminal domain-containing protein n=1 Tax=Paramecium tetraurelia TaxID=5888 RepID=A0C6G0_PARTE|nr:uncharacterized protein GSPATT00035506001 [Paramecium tetraurelia]CAK66377.1 unnamed protein product [Paramecium tetraurelia]|eukprot:XP_001433774.1 hypothetical protein (macronuclear) [Paramecium tetraurelia strain d4-2]
MNQILPNMNSKANALLQLILLTTAGLLLCILLFSTYREQEIPYNGEVLKCKLKYDAKLKCQLNNRTLKNAKITQDDCQQEYICNSILATYPITIIDGVLILVTIVMSLMKHSNLPRNITTFNVVSLISILLSASTLFIMSIVLMTGAKNENLSVWILVIQLLISLLLFASLIFIKKEEEFSNFIKKQEEMHGTEINQYVIN